MFSFLFRDFRFAFRALVKRPLFTTVVVLTLALGIGANSAIFSVVQGVLLRPLPYEDAQRLAVLWHLQRSDGDTGNVSLPNYFDWRAESDKCAGMAAFRGDSVTWLEDGRAERLSGVEATANLFPVLGVEPVKGRAFRPGEQGPGRDRVVIVSHSLWQGRLGGDPEVLGRTLTLDGQPFEVVGVMPPGFKTPFFPAARFWVPLADDSESSCGRGCWAYRAVLRLAPGVGLAEAEAELDGIAARLEEVYPEDNTGIEAHVVPLHEEITGDVRPALLVLLGSVLLLLAIACANVANMHLAHAAANRSEMALLQALGASRAALARRFLAEGMLLAAVGGAFGLLACWAGMDALLALAPDDLPRLSEAAVDSGVLVFCLGLSLGTGILFSVWPALRASRQDPAQALSGGGRHSGGGPGGGRASRALIVVQAGLAVPLLIACGLLLQSLYSLSRVDVGFDSQSLLSLRVALSGERYQRGEARRDFMSRLREQAEALPKAHSAATVWLPPLTDNSVVSSFEIEGRPRPRPGEFPGAQVRIVSPGYLETLGIPVLKGRSFQPSDDANAPPAMMISRSLMQRHWPDGDPLGERVILGLVFPGSEEDTVRRIVGVAGDVKLRGLAHDALPTIYLPYAQSPVSSMSLMMRYAGPAEPLVGAVREIVSRLDPTLAVYDVRTMEESRGEALESPRFYALLLSFFAATAALLATLGVYGVSSYQTTRRVREIGIRMALGARREQVLRRVVASGLFPVLLGLALGLAAAWGVSSLLSGLVFAVSPLDPVTYASVSLLLPAVAALATYAPARRASRIDPAISLRAE